MFTSKATQTRNMIGLLVSLLATLAMVSAQGECPLIDEGVILYPNENDCYSFFQCFNGSLVEKKCPDGLQYNVELEVCDWPWNVNCVDNRGEYILQTIEDIPITQAPPLCPEPGTEVNATFFTNPYNCSTYWFCESGVPLLKECPPGLHFNERIGVCDFPFAANCKEITSVITADLDIHDFENEINPDLEEEFLSATGTPPVCPPIGSEVNVTVFRNPYNCSNYWYCDNGQAHLRDCPPGLQFNEKNGVCDYAWAFQCIEDPLPESMIIEIDALIEKMQGDTDNDLNLENPDESIPITQPPPICPGPGEENNATLIANPYNCSTYWLCENGVPKLRSCPPDLHFNSRIAVCDFKFAANCKEISPVITADLNMHLEENVAIDNLEVEFLSATGTPPVCPPIGSVGNVTSFRNPYNCSNYWNCDNGLASLRDCPPGLQFNEKVGVCDFPWAFQCIEEPLPEYLNMQEKAFLLSQNIEEFVSATGEPPICPPIGSEVNVTVFRNPFNCSNYWYCDNGVPHLRDCPPGLQFNEKNGVCDYAWAFQCIEEPLPEYLNMQEEAFVLSQNIEEFVSATGEPPICPPIGSEVNVTVFRNPFNCSNYWYCDNGVPHLRDCPPGLQFNEKVGVCDFPWAFQCIEEPLPEYLNMQEEALVLSQNIEEFVSATGEPPICPPIGSEVNVTVFRNPFNCSNYWYCDNGVPHLRDCPPGLQFNEKNGVCDYAWAFQCIEEPLPEYLNLQEETVFLSQNVEEFVSATGEPPICPPIGSEVNVTVFRNPFNCSNYWYCDNGVPHLRDCPPGLQFNEKNGVCDFPWAFQCIEEPLPEYLNMQEEAVILSQDVEEFVSATGEPPICPPIGSEVNVTVFRNPFNCSNYWYCDNGVPHLRDCPPGLQFNEKNGVCDYSWAFQCIEEPLPEYLNMQEEAFVLSQNIEEFVSATGEPPICPPVGSEVNVTEFRNPFNCSNYWYCDNGQAFLRDCPPGLQFNEKNGVCDYPWAFECIEEPLPETTTTAESTSASPDTVVVLLENTDKLVHLVNPED